MHRLQMSHGAGGFGKSQVSEGMRQRKELVHRAPHGFVLAF